MQRFRKFGSALAASCLTLALAAIPSAAQAAWVWGATWTSPASSRYLYYQTGNFTVSQLGAISSANLKYDNTVNSTLNISGTSGVSSPGALNLKRFSIRKLSSADWPFDPSTPGITCREETCSESVAGLNGTNQGYIFLNGHFSFTSAFLLQYYAVDTETIVLHELGHAHGLGHPWQDPNPSTRPMTDAEIISVMNATYGVKRILQPDDKSALASIY
jgi:hypothetical protein